jgi:serine protease inhibitor
VSQYGLRGATFGSNANFSGMGDVGLEIDEVLEKAFVESNAVTFERPVDREAVTGRTETAVDVPPDFDGGPWNRSGVCRSLLHNRDG